MKNQVYSREYLRSVPDEKKQQMFDQIINNFQYDVINVAATGKTSFMIDITRIRQNTNCSTIHTDDELVVAIQKRYPDCAVKFDEQWVETGRDTRVRKAGIVIDWS